MRILTTIILFFSLLISLSSVSQVSASTFPNIIPPAPEAQAFMRYGEIPVDYSTGVPKIEVPLFQINSGKLSLPVSVSYHASGIRVNDVASVAGLGWKLSAGGVLTRTVMGKPDDDLYGMLNMSYYTKSQIDGGPQNSEIWNRLNYISKGIYDSESDRYYYSAAGSLSGDFIYDQSSNIVPVTYTDNKISRPSTTQFVVTTPDGTRYIFDKCEYTQVNLDYNHISSWWLSKIISADNADEISFEYQLQNDYTAAFIPMNSVTYTGGSTPMSYGGTQTSTQQLLLKKIVFKDGFVKFDYVADRKDMQSNRLSAVSEYTNNNALIKKYQFIHSYFNGYGDDDKYNYRLKLDRINVFDGNSQYSQNYSFEYDQDHNMPPYIKPGYNLPGSYAIDYFGYYNGVLTNQHLISGILQPPYTGANREANFNYAKTCTLKKINYPTGGSTSFEYESNDPSGGTSSPVGAGLRIHKITSSPSANAVATTKRYEYGSNLLYADMLVNGLNHYTWEPTVFEDIGGCRWQIKSWDVYLSNTLVPFASFNGSPAVYGSVEETTEGSGTAEGIKTHYAYSAENDLIINVDYPRYQDEYFIERPFRKGQLIGIQYYKYTSGPTGAPIYKKVKSVDYEYSVFRASTISAGIKIQRKHEVLCNCPYCDDSYAGGPYFSYFYYFDAQLEVGIKKPTKETTIDFDADGNTVTTTRNISYASANHLFPTSVSNTNSKGETQSTTLKYPHDFAGTAVYDGMIAKNMISPVIEQLSYKNGNFLQSAKTNYNYWYNNAWGTVNANSIIVPQTAESKILANAPEVKLRFHAYDDKGRILSLSKENDARTGYLWDYNNNYPIAEVTNASIDQVAYTSFEADGSGNWSINSSTRSSGGITGSKSYNLGNGSISKAGLNSTTEYVVSYWSSNGVYTVNGNTGTLLQGETILINGANWTYYQHRVTGVSSVSVSGSGNIDELRLYPKGAQMSTYTYTPLIGMTSVCDIANHVSYYEYDGLGRLSVVRDQDRNVLKKYCYNYAGQPQNCDGTVIYSNAGISGTFSKTDCTGGLWGSSVTYSVNPGTYTSTISQADADQKAINDMNANGQAYANTHGVCTVPTWYNAIKSGTFTKVCNTGYAGSNVTYTVQANKYSSLISQADADQKAIADVNANGQTYANANGTCTLIVYYSVEKIGNFSKTDCGTGYIGSVVTLRVPERKYTSTVSQADADQQAQNDLNVNGPLWANKTGTCYAIPTVVTLLNGNQSSSSFTITLTNTSTNQVYTYLLRPSDLGNNVADIPIATYNVTINQGGIGQYDFNFAGVNQIGVNTFSANGVSFSGGTFNIQIEDH